MILVDNVKVEFGRFPNGESNLNFNTVKFGAYSVIKLKFETDQDLFNLFVLKKYIDDVMPKNSIELYILYMPYSRMDRRNQFYTFNLKYVCEFINALNFAHITTFDAHSEVTPALLNRCTDITSMTTLMAVFQKEVGMDNTVIFYPDAGAQKRYGGSFAYPSLIGIKSRDFGSGAIKSYEVHGELPKGSNVLIIDDLCSRGGTFISAAKAIKELGANDIYLMVGHCEETILRGDILWGGEQLIKKVYTTNSIFPDNITVSKDKLYIHKLYDIKKREVI